MLGSQIRRRSVGALTLLLAAEALLVVVVACQGSASSGTAGTGSIATSLSAASSGGTGASGGSGASRSATTAKSVTVATNVGALGVYLVDGIGRTLYMFDADHEGESACYDACATTWPPLTTRGSPTAGENAAGGPLSAITRTDGSQQVLYGVYPLYYFTGDTAPGQTNGQGSGGQWWIVGPDGQPIKAGVRSSPTTSGTTY